MLAHVKILSLWEVAHYWHGYDPRVSLTHHLPLKVRDTLLVFSQEFGNSLSIRVEQDQAYKLEIFKAAPKLTARHYRHSFKQAIDKKVFGKRFFSHMFITRSQLARWCVSKNEPLPKFWFPDNDKFPYNAEGDLTDEITANGSYKVQVLYDDRPKSANNGVPQVQTIAALVNENTVQADHDITNSIKDKLGGITKQRVIAAFEGLHFDSDAKWGKALASPPDWLKECRVTKGNKSTSATWNPVLIAAALFDKGVSIKKLDAVFVGLSEWTEEWSDISAIFR